MEAELSQGQGPEGLRHWAPGALLGNPALVPRHCPDAGLSSRAWLPRSPMRQCGMGEAGRGMEGGERAGGKGGGERMAQSRPHWFSSHPQDQYPSVAPPELSLLPPSHWGPPASPVGCGPLQDREPWSPPGVTPHTSLQGMGDAATALQLQKDTGALFWSCSHHKRCTDGETSRCPHQGPGKQRPPTQQPAGQICDLTQDPGMKGPREAGGSPLSRWRRTSQEPDPQRVRVNGAGNGACAHTSVFTWTVCVPGVCVGPRVSTWLGWAQVCLCIYTHGCLSKCVLVYVCPGLVLVCVLYVQMSIWSSLCI